jgi:hypothetical protein
VSQGALKAAEVTQTTFVVIASSSNSKSKSSKKHNNTSVSVAKEPESSTAANSDKTIKKKKQGPCRLCNDGSRHWARGPDCKFKKTPQPKSDGVNSGGLSDDSEGQMVNFIYSEPSDVALSTADKVKNIDYLDKYDIPLDNQCTASLFHKCLKDKSTLDIP